MPRPAGAGAVPVRRRRREASDDRIGRCERVSARGHRRGLHLEGLPHLGGDGSPARAVGGRADRAAQRALILIPPLVPAILIFGPPPFIRASRLRREDSVFSSCTPSASIPPFATVAEIVAAASAGSRSLIAPFVHPSFTPPFATDVKSTSTPPLVVVASIGPLISRATIPPLT